MLWCGFVEQGRALPARLKSVCVQRSVTGMKTNKADAGLYVQQPQQDSNKKIKRINQDRSKWAYLCCSAACMHAMGVVSLAHRQSDIETSHHQIVNGFSHLSTPCDWLAVYTLLHTHCVVYNLAAKLCQERMSVRLTGMNI